MATLTPLAGAVTAGAATTVSLLVRDDAEPVPATLV